MSLIQSTVKWFIDSGVHSEMAEADTKYIRFLNATLVLFGLGQIPILALLINFEMWFQLATNFGALALCGLGFILNRQGHHLAAKIMVILVVTANTAYFSSLLGSSAPTHFWLIPAAVIGVLAFKPREWIWAVALVGLSVLLFAGFEFSYMSIEPVVKLFDNSMDELQSAHGSTVASMILTLVLVGMMHRRFLKSETALSDEKAQSDRLLRAILPDEIAEELRTTGTTQAVRHEDVSILFADLVGFTPLSASMPAEDVVHLLAQIFERFDTLIETCGVEKIKTIGDAYMVAGGVPKHSPDHARRLARCAVGMLDSLDQFNRQSGHTLALRIGLHRGPAVAGVIGTTKFAYDLWGESVNLAARLESSGAPGRIHVSDAFRNGLEPEVNFETRGEITLKGVGPTQTHWLV